MDDVYWLEWNNQGPLGCLGLYEGVSLYCMMLVFFRSGEISKSLLLFLFYLHLFSKGIKTHQIVSYYPLLEGVCNRDVHWNEFSLFFLHA